MGYNKGGWKPSPQIPLPLPPGKRAQAEHSACDARQDPGRSRVPDPARLGHACDPGPCPPLSTCREGSQSRNPGNEAAERELQWWGGLAPGQSAGHPPGPPPRPRGPGMGQGQSSSPACGSSRRRLTLPQETGQNIRWGLGLPSRPPTSNALRGPEVPCGVTSPKPLVRYKCHWEVILRPWPLVPELPKSQGAARAPHKGGNCLHTVWPPEMLE